MQTETGMLLRQFRHFACIGVVMNITNRCMKMLM